MKYLLAKSTKSEDKPASPETLRGHTACVVAAAERILAHRGVASLAVGGLPTEWEARLSRIVWLAAYCHDLGKCSDHFQQMVRGKRREPQLVRHEALALWLLWPGCPLAAWARTGVDSDADYVTAVIAAAGHHRKFTGSAIAPDGSGAGVSLVLHTGHSDFGRVLGYARGRLGEPPSLSNILIEDTRRTPLRKQLEAWEEEGNEMLRDVSARRLLAIAKALVLSADVAGSALPKGGERPAWIDEQLVVPNVATARADREGIVRKRIGGGELRLFQRSVAASTAPITFVRAGCGSGKTLAAYQWAAEQHPTRQLWVTYPTTGTATEGFRDYLQPTDVPARLDHGRAEVDVDIFHLRDGEAGARALDRLESIRNWGADVVTCTVDTVLGLIQCQRRGLYAWPGLSHGAVVFDEIHAYDDDLFGSLLRFLEALPGIPVLLMTASLPDARRASLEDLCQRVHGTSISVVEGPDDLEALQRYRLKEAQDPWPEVCHCLDAGGKVLWVSNTVNRCMAVADSSPARFSPLVYHSRFRYIDRVERHREVVEAFKGGDAALAVTTQVAEMSLDLSADLLVTDLAPIPAMIQRLGRLNRRSKPDAPLPVKPFLVCAPPHHHPYEEKAIQEARGWLDVLQGRDLSQRDLTDAWEQSPTGSPAARRTSSAWLDGQFQTMAAQLRQSSEGITILLEDDAKAVKRGTAKLVEVALPMGPPPRVLNTGKWETEQFLPIAPKVAISYDQKRGGRWQK